MGENELGQKVPRHVADEASKYDILKCPKYVYKDGNYGREPPVASIGCRKPKRFGSVENAEELKVKLLDGWVSFRSPNAGNNQISEGKGMCEPCLICGEDRFTEQAHFPKPSSRDGIKTIPLCPTHHKLLDNGRISLNEFKEIWKREFHRFNSFNDFMSWACENGYDYSISEILDKKIYDDYDEKEISYTVKN